MELSGTGFEDFLRDKTTNDSIHWRKITSCLVREFREDFFIRFRVDFPSQCYKFYGIRGVPGLRKPAFQLTELGECLKPGV